MARWTRDEELNQPADFVQFMMEDFLTKNGCYPGSASEQGSRKPRNNR